MPDPTLLAAAVHAATFAATYATLHAAHEFGDHWIQTSRQAANKGEPGWRGRLACAAHVASYTATAAAMMAVMLAVTGLPVPVWRVAGGLAVSAVSHYIIDRRAPLEWLACRVAGKERFFRLGAPRPGRDDNTVLGTGAYALDQSAHTFFLFIAALIV